jgi:hypothetical protein
VDPKVAWDVVLAFAGGIGVAAGIVGFALGVAGYEAHCPAGVGVGNCFMAGGEIFGTLYAGSSLKAGFLLGAIFAAAAALVAGWYNEREQKRKAAFAGPGV